MPFFNSNQTTSQEYQWAFQWPLYTCNAPQPYNFIILSLLVTEETGGPTKIMTNKGTR